MANTGYKAWNTLEEYDINTGQATGNTKPNVDTDPDYVAPVYDTSYCPLPSLTISPSNYNAGGGVETFTINVTSNISWTAVSENSWMIITSNINGTGNGTVEVTISKNNVSTIRTGNIRIEGEGIVRYCGVNQNIVDEIEVTPNYLYFPYTGGSDTVSVNSDSAWTANIVGASLTPNSGGAGITSVNVSTLQQANSSNVISEIIIALDNGENSTILTVEQEGNPNP